jgi:hypothetical protein
MRLRQVALVAAKLEPVVENFKAVLGLDVAYRDPEVAVFGLINAVLPVGDEFLEVVEPVTADASAGRYLKRRGGDAGYMVILQAQDALPHRGRVTGMGVRNIAEMTTKKYTFTHFHPGDFGGVLTSIDSVGGVSDYLAPDGDWPPAGPDWRAHKSAPETLGLMGVVIQAADPAASARRWAELLEASVEAGSEGPMIRLAKGMIRFVPPVDGDGTGVVGLDVAVRDPAAPLARARQRGLPVAGETISIGGVGLNLVRPASRS